MLDALELACHAVARPLPDVQRAIDRVEVHMVDAFAEQHMEQPRRVYVEVRSTTGYTPPATGYSRSGPDAIDLVIVGSNRRKGWSSELVRALPAKRVLLMDWGTEYIEQPRGQWDEPSFDYRCYLDALHRVEPHAFAGRQASDEDLVLLVLSTLDRERNRRAKAFKFDGLPSCCIVQGSATYGGASPFGDRVEEAMVDAHYYGMREGIYEGQLSARGKRWQRWLNAPSLDIARKIAVFVLTECELRVSTASIEYTAQALFSYANKLTPAQRNEVIATAKKGKVTKAERDMEVDQDTTTNTETT